MNQRIAITSLKLTNVRRFSGAHSFNFTDPQGAPLQTIILAGPNGCGKTTILETILLMLGQRALIERGERGSQLPFIDPNIKIFSSIELTVNGTLTDSKYLKIINPPDIEQTNFNTNNALDIYIKSKEISASIKVEYYASWRAPELSGSIKNLGKGNRRQENDTNRLRNIKQRIVDHRAKKGFRPSNGPSKDDQWLSKMNEFWGKFRQDDTYIDADFIENIGEDTDPYFDLFICKKDHTGKVFKVCSIDALSAGELELLQLAGSIITREVDLDLLVIDEPELHLHPQWQSGLLPALRSLLPNTQFIIATHSDLIWDQALSFERFLLVPKDDPRHSES